LKPIKIATSIYAEFAVWSSDAITVELRLSERLLSERDFNKRN